MINSIVVYRGPRVKFVVAPTTLLGYDNVGGIKGFVGNWGRKNLLG